MKQINEQQIQALLENLYHNTNISAKNLDAIRDFFTNLPPVTPDK